MLTLFAGSPSGAHQPPPCFHPHYYSFPHPHPPFHHSPAAHPLFGILLTIASPLRRGATLSGQHPSFPDGHQGTRLGRGQSLSRSDFTRSARRGSCGRGRSGDPDRRRGRRSRQQLADGRRMGTEAERQRCLLAEGQGSGIPVTDKRTVDERTARCRHGSWDERDRRSGTASAGTVRHREGVEPRHLIMLLYTYNLQPPHRASSSTSS